MIYGLVYGLALGLVAGLWAGRAYGLADGLVFGIGWWLMAGLVVWLATTLAVGQSGLVKLTELALNRLRRRRVHFLSLLEDAFGRQVLRKRAPSTRSAALQAHLAAMYSRSQTL
jgi:hypothetical protein